MKDDRLAVLLGRHFEEALTVTDAAELNELLAASAEARAAFWREARMHARLRQWGEQQAGSADCRSVKERSFAERKTTNVVGSLLAIVALVLLAFVLGRRESPASAAEMIRAALLAHAERVERVYLVSEVRARPDEPGFRLPNSIRVATLGDRFWVEMDQGQQRWMWGREPDGTIWLTLDAHRAMRIELAETGVPLHVIAEIYSLRVESLLNNVLKRCRLEHMSAIDMTQVITATPKQFDLSWMQSMTLEIDRETKAVRRLILVRDHATTTFTLIETRSANDRLYHVEGHLAQPTSILSRASEPDDRLQILTNKFGPEAGLWITK